MGRSEVMGLDRKFVGLACQNLQEATLAYIVLSCTLGFSFVRCYEIQWDEW
jgi:hypothetical protein